MRTSESFILTEPLPPSLAEFVRQFVFRRRRLSVLYVSGVVVAFVLIWTLAWSLFDRLIPTPAWFRCLLLLIEASAVVIAMIRPLSRLFSRSVPWHQAAAAIEASDPQFGGGLQTAMSQLFTPVEHRGSAALLGQVVDEAAARVIGLDPRILLPSSKSLRPAAVAAMALLLICSLFASSWLDLPRLLKRQWVPFFYTPPVTTTRLFIEPGSVSVIEGDQLKISVTAERLNDSQPLLQWRGDDPVFSSAVMLPEPGGYSYTFSSVDRPFTYRVSGGDAASSLFDVHVIARPSVRELRVGYAYPDWTELPPKDLATSTGDLFAPAGTMATILIAGTQALSRADGLFEGETIESTPTVDPAVRQLKIPMRTSGRWQLALTNSNQITGTGPSGMMIRVQPAQVPKASLQLPSREEELRLQPRDVLKLGYEASDQFALAQISAEIAVNSNSPVVVPIPLGRNHRLQSGSFDVDLAQLAVNLGDVVTVTLVAQNRAGLHTTSSPCRIVISPRSIDLNAEDRLAELRESARLSKLLSDEIDAASKALDQSPPGDAKEARDAEIAPHLAVADGVGAELSRQLLRALMHSDSAELSNSLECLLDTAQRATSGLEKTDAAILTEMRDALRNRLNRLAGFASDLRQPLDVFWRGEAAAQLLNESENAKAEEARIGSLFSSEGDAVRRSMQRATDDQHTGCVQLGVDPNAADMKQQLQRFVDQALDVAKRFGAVDFASVANEWSNAGAADETALVARLTIASQAEAIRPSGDFIWARDLQLGARAARRIDISKDLPAEARKDYPSALRALQLAHVLIAARTPAEQLTQPLKDAEEARHRMRLWAGEFEPASQPSASQIAADPERAALETAAAEAQRKLRRDAGIDQATTMEAPPLLNLPTTADASSAEAPASPAEIEKMKQAIATARQLERLTVEQRMLRRETSKASDAELAGLAKQQAALTDAIQHARSEEKPADQAQGDAPKDSRESAMNAIRSAEESLAEIPKEIEKAREAENLQHQANQSADDARHAVDASEPDTKGAAEQIANETHSAADAAKRQASAAQVSPDESASLAASIRQFAPEATPAVDTIDQQLTPAISAMRQTQSTGDHDGYQRAAQQATQAASVAEHQLNEGLQSLLKRDALTTAKFFSNKASQALAKAQPDRAAAVRLQRGASAALEQAWDDALHQSAGQRLARMPSMSAILRLYPAEGGVGGQSILGAEPAPAEREWGRLREQKPEDISIGSHEIDPPEYQDSLRVYFKDLAREDATVRP